MNDGTNSMGKSTEQVEGGVVSNVPYLDPERAIKMTEEPQAKTSLTGIEVEQGHLRTLSQEGIGEQVNVEASDDDEPEPVPVESLPELNVGAVEAEPEDGDEAEFEDDTLVSQPEAEQVEQVAETDTSMLAKTVPTVKKHLQSNPEQFGAFLAAEQAGENRSTLVGWMIDNKPAGAGAGDNPSTKEN